MRYTIIADYGKPYTVEVENELQLKTEMDKLKAIHDSEEYPFFDVVILDENQQEVTY